MLFDEETINNFVNNTEKLMQLLAMSEKPFKLIKEEGMVSVNYNDVKNDIERILKARAEEDAEVSYSLLTNHKGVDNYMRFIALVVLNQYINVNNIYIEDFDYDKHFLELVKLYKLYYSNYTKDAKTKIKNKKPKKK